MTLRLIATGGTFDKHYDAIKGELTFKDSHLPAILAQSRVTIPVEIEIKRTPDWLRYDVFTLGTARKPIEKHDYRSGR